MISIFDNKGNRMSISYGAVEFNNPVMGRMEVPTGNRIDNVGFSTPTNFHSESISDIVKNGGGVETYNPLVGTRVLNMRGSVRAKNESELMSQIMTMQRELHPLFLQSTLALNRSGTLVWPPPNGLADWIRSRPLKFTRQLPYTVDQTAHADGLFELQYHCLPLQLPDPIRASVSQGLGADFEVQFLLMDGGRAYDQTEKTLAGDGDITWGWGVAPVWPVIEATMGGAGSATCTITTTQGHMGTALVLDLSSLGDGDTVKVDTRENIIYVNGTRNMTVYVSGSYPVLRGAGDTTVAWTNTTNIDAGTNLLRYRESDYV